MSRCCPNLSESRRRSATNIFLLWTENGDIALREVVPVWKSYHNWWRTLSLLRTGQQTLARMTKRPIRKPYVSEIGSKSGEVNVRNAESMNDTTYKAI